MNTVYDSAGKLLRFSCCFVALELPNYESSWPEDVQVEGIRLFLNGLARGLYTYGTVSASEERLFREFSKSPASHLFESWLTTCIKNRRGYEYLNILPIDFVFRRKKLSAELAKKSFIKAHIFTTGEMTHTYDYLLNGLRQMTMLDVKLPEQHSAWRSVAISLGPVPWYPYTHDEPM
jgi:hypothetical protein